MTIEIPVRRGGVTVIDDDDADLAEFKWSNENGYALRYACYLVDGKWKHYRIYLARTILERKLSRPLNDGELCDHADCNTLNNRRSNLRAATPTENTRNRRFGHTNKHGLRGVKRDFHRWEARIKVNGKRIELGRFDTKEEAHEAYCRAAIEYFGEFARLD